MRIQFKAGEACAWLPSTLCAPGVCGNTAFSKPDPGSPADVFISSFSTWEAGVWPRLGFRSLLTTQTYDLRPTPCASVSASGEWGE